MLARKTCTVVVKRVGTTMEYEIGIRKEKREKSGTWRACERVQRDMEVKSSGRGNGK
jgi:hypothetical protein